MKGSTLIPALRYENPDTAIDWLCNVLGFEEHTVFRDENNHIVHAQLIFNNSMIMLGPMSDTEYGRLVKLPSDMEGYNTQSVYIVVESVKDHYDHAVKHGAQIELPFESQDHGGSAYTCRDPQGHLWNIGDYDPWT